MFYSTEYSASGDGEEETDAYQQTAETSSDTEEPVELDQRLYRSDSSHYIML